MLLLIVDVNLLV